MIKTKIKKIHIIITLQCSRSLPRYERSGSEQIDDVSRGTGFFFFFFFFFVCVYFPTQKLHVSPFYLLRVRDVMEYDIETKDKCESSRLRDD